MKKLKKIITLLLIISISMNLNLNVYATSDDTDGPVVGNIRIDKTEVTAGDAIKVTVEISDASMLRTMTISVGRQAYDYNYIHLTDNGDGTYSGTLTITDSYVNGGYYINYYNFEDMSGNKAYAFPSASLYPNTNFMVSGCSDDTAAPVVGNIRIDKTEVTAGDAIKVTVEISDASMLRTMTISVGRQAYDYNYIHLTDNGDGTYSGTLTITDSYVNGGYYINYYNFEDMSGNKAYAFPLASAYPDANFTIYSELDAPIIFQTSLAVALQQATIGETERLYFKASDASGIKDGSVTYITPKTKEEKTYPCSYDAANDQYYSEIPVTEYTQSGKWILKSITLNDNLISTAKIISSEAYTGENTVENSIDLSLGDFEVINTIEDTVAPIIETNSITMISNQINLNGSFVFQLKATDDLSGIESVKANYLNPDGQVYTCNMNLKEDNIYEGIITVEDSQLLGKWNIQSICISDVCGNKQEYTSLLGKLNFTVIDAYSEIGSLDKVTWYLSNQTVSSSVIKGDVYIGPNAVVTFNNVTVTGNIYVLGGLRAVSITADGIYCGSMSFGYFGTFYNGTALLSGSNYINSIVCLTYPVTELPLIIAGNIYSANGYLNMKGVTVPVVNVYVNGKPVETNAEGKFYINDLYIGDADSITVQLTTVFGNTILKTYSINKYLIDESGNLNMAPVITAENIIYTKNQEYDLLDGITAYDNEDGSMTDKITILSNNLDITKSGTYSITYGVTDSGNASVQKTVKILVPKSGDVTFDNAIDIFDILSIQRYILGTSELAEKSMIVADVTGNSKVDVFDILAIQRHILGVEIIK
ncbi:dockerin type I domain-containing protein [[Clostridium] fimetarium]|uniref:Dockerin domain-containing protein n=1 Tax=[Clostridium] fimetarium TaxID=99656 RepID=A0A1I0MC07_9FIRM|nr:dockerin type I domain-containing protein [[Clostridium] fimetarium]SEV85832.1 protein of unknown function [[Clostridium] fimetarium]